MSKPEIIILYMTWNYSCIAFLIIHIITSICLQDIQRSRVCTRSLSSRWLLTNVTASVERDSPSDEQFRLICGACMPQNTPQRIFAAQSLTPVIEACSGADTLSTSRNDPEYWPIQIFRGLFMTAALTRNLLSSLPQTSNIEDAKPPVWKFIFPNRVMVTSVNLQWRDMSSGTCAE